MLDNVKLYEVLDESGIACVRPSGGREFLPKGAFVWSNDIEKGLFKLSHLEYAVELGRLKKLKVEKETKIMPKGDVKSA